MSSSEDDSDFFESVVARTCSPAAKKKKAARNDQKNSDHKKSHTNCKSVDYSTNRRILSYLLSPDRHIAWSKIAEDYEEFKDYDTPALRKKLRDRRDYLALKLKARDPQALYTLCEMFQVDPTTGYFIEHRLTTEEPSTSKPSTSKPPSTLTPTPSVSFLPTSTMAEARLEQRSTGAPKGLVREYEIDFEVCGNNDHIFPYLTVGAKICGGSKQANVVQIRRNVPDPRDAKLNTLRLVEGGRAVELTFEAKPCFQWKNNDRVEKAECAAPVPCCEYTQDQIKRENQQLKSRPNEQGHQSRLKTRKFWFPDGMRCTSSYLNGLTTDSGLLKERPIFPIYNANEKKGAPKEPRKEVVMVWDIVVEGSVRDLDNGKEEDNDDPFLGALASLALSEDDEDEDNGGMFM